jgi:REP element-mobilizing transposase RayT
MKQKDLNPKGSGHSPNPEFGGGNSHTTHPTTRRSFSSKHKLHITMKSRCATGSRSMLAPNNKSKIDAIVRESARRFHVKIYSFENTGNHLHLVIQTAKREWLSNFLRTVSALIARHVMKAHRGSPLADGVKFWHARPLSKIIT